MNIARSIAVILDGSGGLVGLPSLPDGYAFVVDDNSPFDYIVDDNNPSNYIAEPV